MKYLKKRPYHKDLSKTMLAALVLDTDIVIKSTDVCFFVCLRYVSYIGYVDQELLTSNVLQFSSACLFKANPNP